MEITRDVILDLLPLYLADEASADTRALVEQYLETDPQMANIARRSAAIQLPGDIPIPLTEEDQMKAYREAKRLLYRRIFILAVVISFALLALLGMAFGLLAFRVLGG